jgi:hypothetical protein
MLACALLMLLAQCRCPVDEFYEIDLVNNADHNIGYYFADGGKYGTYYPDSLPQTSEYVVYDISKVTSPGLGSSVPWDEFFDGLPRDTLSLFIFHTDTLNEYTWEEVRDGYMILRRYDLSEADVKRMNYRIVYP